jgi:hypothetical protein
MSYLLLAFFAIAVCGLRGQDHKKLLPAYLCGIGGLLLHSTNPAGAFGQGMALAGSQPHVLEALAGGLETVPAEPAEQLLGAVTEEEPAHGEAEKKSSKFHGQDDNTTVVRTTMLLSRCVRRPGARSAAGGEAGHEVVCRGLITCSMVR